MRIALTMAFVLALISAAVAQSDDFNPYQAVLDRMPFAQAEPLIEAAYGPITQTYADIGKPYEGGPVRIALVGNGTGGPFFLFCEDKLAAISARVTAKVAAAILVPLTRPPSGVTIVPHDSGVWFESEDRTVSVDYRGVGSKASFIIANYPAEYVLGLNFAKRCAQVAD